MSKKLKKRSFSKLEDCCGKAANRKIGATAKRGKAEGNPQPFSMRKRIE